MANSSFVVTVETGEPAALALVENESIALAADAAQLIHVTLLESNPGMAAVGMPSQTMVAVSPAPKLEIVTGAFLTIAALPITTLREATTRTAQSVVSLGLPNGLTVAAAI